MSNTTRQQAYRAAQAEKGRKPIQIYMTEDERFYIERTLEAMRATGAKPAALRDCKGRYLHLDT